jgi:hypothetical protein
MRSFTVLFFFFAVISHIHGKRRPDPLNGLFYVEASVGEPWPKPQTIQTTGQQSVVDSSAFHFLLNSTSQTCDLLTNAFDRYYKLIFFPEFYLNYILNPESVDNQKKFVPKKNLANLRDTPVLKRLNVYVQQPCDQYPTLESDESCRTNSALFVFLNLFSFLKIHLLLTAIMVCLKLFLFGVLFVVLKHSVKLFIAILILE